MEGILMIFFFSFRDVYISEYDIEEDVLFVQISLDIEPYIREGIDQPNRDNFIISTINDNTIEVKDGENVVISDIYNSENLYLKDDINRKSDFWPKFTSVNYNYLYCEIKIIIDYDNNVYIEKDHLSKYYYLINDEYKCYFDPMSNVGV